MFIVLSRTLDEVGYYDSAKMQSSYSTAPAVWAENILGLCFKKIYFIIICITWKYMKYV